MIPIQFCLRFSSLVPGILGALVAGALSEGAVTQCATQWLPGSGVPGADARVWATTMWDPDGAGPLQPRLVVAGDLRAAGTTAANSIAAYDPATGIWSSLGAGTDGRVFALMALPNGDLVAGGQFARAGGVIASGIARWDGTSWSALGAGILGGNVLALTMLPNGDVVAGGNFLMAGGVSANNVARWDGTSWSALGWGVGSSVDALVTLPNGNLVAGGYFTTAGGASANHIARWDGTSWSPLGSGVGLGSGHIVDALAVLPNGDLVVGGLFSTAGGTTVQNIARWNGASWSAMGGTSGDVRSLTVLPNGDLVVGGSFATAGGTSAQNIARWNGMSWSALGAGILGNSVHALTTLPNGDLAVAGWFTTAGGVAASNLALWDGASWSAFGAWIAPDGPVLAFTKLPNGDLVVGGEFATVGGVSANGIARWNGATWSALGTWMGLGQVAWPPSISALTTLPNGDVVAGGVFTNSGGVSANRIARWNGTSWSALGSGLGGRVRALVVLPNGDIVAGLGGGAVQRWDGASWSSLGSVMWSGIGYSYDPFVGAFAVLPNGDLVAAGQFEFAGGVSANNIAIWDGTSWAALGAGLRGGSYPGPIVNALTTLPNGDIVAAGRFSFAGVVTANHIASWDGTSWSPLGSGFSGELVDSLTTLPNGDLVVGGQTNYFSGRPLSRIERWNGPSRSTLGSGIAGPFGASVFALAMLPNGDLVAGGVFTVANGSVSPYLAQLTTTCPATALSAGSGCGGAGTTPTLAATELPWLGSTCRTRGTGLPASALVVAVLGLNPWSLPLASVFQQALPGCVLHTTPDATLVGSATNGAFDFALAIPNTATLVGASVFHQMVVQELGPQQQLLAMTAANALQLTAGKF